MTDIASLGIEVQTGDVTKAGAELDKFVQAGEKAEKAAEGIGQSFDKASTAATGLAGAETKLGESTEDAKARLLAMAKASLDSSEYLKSLASSVSSSTSAMDAARATTTDYAALNRRLKADSDALVGTVDKQADASRLAAAATGVQAEDLAKLLGQINPTTAALARLDEQQRQLNQHRAAGNIDKDGFKAYSADIEAARGKIKGFSDESVKAKDATDSFGLSTRGAQQNVLQLINALSSGNWSSGLHAIARLGIGAGISGAGISSLFSGGAGAAALGESLASIADKSKDVAENAGEAGESISDLAEKSNTAAESTENAKKALEALSVSTGPVGLGMAGLVAGMLAAAAAVGVLVYGYYQGSKEADAYNKSLILTGNYAGTSAGQLADLARQVSATNGTTGDAAATLAKLAGSGVIASSSFKEIADAAAAMEDATGRSVDATIAEFVKIAKDPVAAAKELNDQYHFLTASVYSQIVALKEQGDTTAATDLLTKTYAETVQDRSRQITDNLGTIERAWKGIKDAAAGALDATLNIGRALTLEQQAQFIRDRLATNQGRGGRPAALGLETRDIAKDQAALAYLELQIDAEKTKSTYLGEQRKIQDDSLNAMIKVDALTKSSWTNEQKRNEALKEYRKQLEAIRKANPDDARLNQGAIDKNIANINTRFKDSKGSSAGAVDLTEFNASHNAIKAILAEYANAQKELDALQKAGLVSQEEYSWKRAGLIGNEKDEITAAYEAEISALESANARKTTTTAQAIELDKKIADARTDMVKAQQDADSQLKVLEINQEGRLKKQTLAIDSYIDALARQNQALQQAGQRAAVGVGQGDRQNVLNGELNGIEDRANQQRLDLARDKADAARNMSADEYIQKLAAINKSESDLKETTLSNYQEMSAAQRDWRNGATSAFQNYLDSARDVAGQTKALFSNAFSSMEDAVVNFAMTGKLSFADFTKSILADMARIATRQAASGLLSGLVGSAFGSYFGGGGSTVGTSGFSENLAPVSYGGGRAAGGGVAPNTLYEVNEKGPELFNQGGRSFLMTGAAGGSVTPLNAGGGPGIAAMSGGGGTTVNLSLPIMVMTDEESGRPEGAELDTEAFQRNMQERMRTVAKEEIAKSWRQGGVSSRNVKG